MTVSVLKDLTLLKGNVFIYLLRSLGIQRCRDSLLNFVSDIRNITMYKICHGKEKEVCIRSRSVI